MFKLDHDKFAAAMIRALHKAGIEDGFVYDPERFAIVSESEPGNVSYLGNAYAAHCAAPFWQRGSVIGAHARALAASRDIPDVETIDQARSMLRAVVRARGYLEQARLMSLAEDATPAAILSRVVAEHLTVEVCLDLPTFIRSVSSDDLDKWGVTFEEALSMGMDNLRAVSQDSFQKASDGVYVSPWRDNYDASRMILPEIFDRLPLKGRPVVFVPNRDVLIVTGDADPIGLASAAAGAEGVFSDPRPLSGRAFRLAATWEPFLPAEPDHPARPKMERLIVQDTINEYASQADCLERLHKQKNIGIFVASALNRADKATGAVTTFATWTEGVDSLLPVTDKIVLCNIGRDGKPALVGIAPWAKVQEVAGDLMVAEDYYPPRYRVNSFPTAEQIAAIAPEKPDGVK